MKIRELFEKPIDRFIEGVIKADDDRNLIDEMDEYIITKDISKKLRPILENYSSNPKVNGVWISGFFGSGKSHLLKMLSMAMERKTIEGKDLSEIFLEKIRETSDEFLIGDMEKTLRIPSKSILFNIDQKADSTVQYTTNRILGVFLKVFNELCGYCSTLPFFAEFERDMDSEGVLNQLKQTFHEQTGKSWEKERIRFHTIRSDEFAATYTAVRGGDLERAQNLLTEYRETFNLSIESFAEKIKAYVQAQPEGFRLNFFVDEVGQFIADNTQRMLNLQTVVETLNTVCEGQAWIFVTSQASLEAVVGRDPGQDFSRIQDRFRVKVNLDGKDVSEVIQLRLLKKKREYISDLNQTYEREKENIRTLYTFGDGTQTYQTINSADEFVKTYPVIPYQYDLFQRVMIGLSSHSAFTGQQTSVGERSMLGVFQDVLKEMADLDETNLASFDKMFQGIRQALRPNYLNLINLAENNLSHQPLALKLLRALALVKYVDSFKATIQNLSILLIDEFQVPIGEFQKQVAESLQLLEQQTYIQRNGDLYSYLTNIEKDVENEIKTTSISDSDQIKLLSDIIFNEVIQTKQYRFDDNRQNYIFARKMDGTLALGQDAELAINVVGPFHENSGNESIIRNQSMGKAEMLVLLSEDRDLLEDLTMFLKTERYLKTSGMGQVDDSVRSIHREKGDINQNRRRQLRARVENLLKESKIIVSNRELDLSGDGTTKLERGFQELIRATYPQLNMLNGHPNYQETDLQSYLMDDFSDLFGGQTSALTEAELEIQNFLRQRFNRGESNHFKDLIQEFTTKPYGWPLPAVQCLLAQLYRKGRVEVRFEGTSLDERMLLQKLPQSNQTHFLALHVLEEIDPQKLNRFKSFHQDFFRSANPGTDYRNVIREFRTSLDQMIHDYEQLYLQQSVHPFLSSLGPSIELLKELKNKDDSSYLEDLENFRERYLDLLEDDLDPIQTFMKGSQFKVYNEVIEYWLQNQDDAKQLESNAIDAIQRLVDSQKPWDDTQAAKSSLEVLRTEIEEKKEKVREEASVLLKEKKGQIQYEPKFIQINEEQKQQILKPLDDLEIKLTGFKSIAAIEALKQKIQTIYVEQLNQLAKMEIEGEGVSDNKISISSNEIKVDYSVNVISNQKELDEYVVALTNAYQKVLEQNKKIALS